MIFAAGVNENMKKSNLKVIIFYIVLIAVIVIASASLFSAANRSEATYSDVLGYFRDGRVIRFVVDGNNNLTMELRAEGDIWDEEAGALKEGAKASPEDPAVMRETYKVRDYYMFYTDVKDTVEAQKQAGVIDNYDFPPPTELPWWVSFLPYLIVIALFIVSWMYMINQTSGGGGGRIGSFGRSRARLVTNDKKKVTFRDVAIVEFLRDPNHFTKLGARIPHGVLLVGPPGTGKTLLAKAVAGEAGVPFYSISGSDFVEMYVGVGASRVRDLFETAKKNPASIIFIDEIDAVGRHRGAGLGGGHDEREQTLNQLLVEMDGFGSGSGTIVMAATNRPDILDPALLRPGRFDRQITVSYPDVKGREAILKVHGRGKPFEADVDFATVAKTTVGFTGADLENLLNEAALLAARKGKTLIGMADLEDAMIKVIVGPSKRSKVISDKEKRLTAYHESGHAIVTKFIQPDEPVHQISIIPSGRAGGYTLSLPKDDKAYMSKNDMKHEIVTLLGGRVAEAIIFDDISTGASNDIQRATSIARNMVTKYGMSDELGPIVYGAEHDGDEVFLGRDFSATRNYSEETAYKIDNEIKAIVEEAYAEAKRILTENIGKLHFVAGYLIANEIMDENQFDAAMTQEGVTYEQLDEMVAEKRRRSEEENERRRQYLSELERKERLRQQEEERREREMAQRHGADGQGPTPPPPPPPQQ